MYPEDAYCNCKVGKGLRNGASQLPTVETESEYGKGAEPPSYAKLRMTIRSGMCEGGEGGGGGGPGYTCACTNEAIRGRSSMTSIGLCGDGTVDEDDSVGICGDDLTGTSDNAMMDVSSVSVATSLGGGGAESCSCSSGFRIKHGVVSA
jgi:hypothetical protein